MSRERVEQVLRGYAAINAGDLEAATERLPDDFELVLPPLLPDVEAYHGPEGLRRAVLMWSDTFDDFQIEIEEVIDGGDKVVVMAAVRGVGKDSGAEVRSPSFPHVWTFEGDLPVRMESLPNRATAVEALGLED